MRGKLLLFLLGMQLGFSQAINVDLNTYTVPQLVSQVLFSGGSGGAACVGTITNVTWSTGTNFGSVTGGQPDNGIGYFTNVNTTFPLANGVILSTGRATAAAGPNANTQSNGAFTWPGDTELFDYITALGIDPQLDSYNNATILEFDFVPFANSMSFDFLFASEEYGTFQCDYSDAFAFFLQNTTQGTPVTNLALVPNTTDPISVTTIRSDAYNTTCGSVNQNFFGVYNVVGPAITATNFNGHTVRMTASSAVVPGDTYHIKLVIGDRNDNAFDSAVFLAGGSFDIGELEIASDPTTGGLPGFTLAAGTALCAGSPQDIVVGTLIPGATYNWFNGTTLVQSGPSNVLTVTQAGTYSVEVIAPGGCQIPVANTFLVEEFPPLPAGTPLDLFNVGLNTIFNLTTNTPLILNGIPNPGDFAVSYYTSLADLQNQQNEITNINAYPSLSNGQTIYALVYDQFGTYPCLTVRTFTLNYAAVCETITNPSSNQVLCEGTDPTVFSVTTNATAANSIKFVYFNAPQTGDAMYSGGTVLGTVTPAAGVATYDAGVLGATGSLPNTPGMYYVYAILNPTPSDATCRPNQLIQVVVNDGANAGADGAITLCETNTATINLNTLISGQDPGGTWVRTTGTGGVFNAAAGLFSPTAGSTTSTFTYTVNGIPPCLDDSSVASVIINPQPDAGLDGQIQICETSVTTINLFSLISGEETGGTWVRTTGTGGVFNAAAGTFTPGLGVTTSTFTYTIVGTAPCVDDSSVATVEVVSQPNAGTNGSVSICSNDPSTINLNTVISGQQTGGVWTRTTGTGGVFNAAAGTFTLTVGATSSSFTYTIPGILPCVPSSSVASVNIVPQSNAGVDGATTVCETSTLAIDLSSLITGEQTGGIWTRTSGSGGVFNAAAGTFTPALGATSSVFTYTLTGTTPCANDSSEVVVTIQPQPQAGIDGGLTICNISTSTIDLFTLISGEQTGGTWTRTTGTGGTFNAALGTFTPSLTTTSSSFTYTVSGVAPCIADSSVASLTVNIQPTAGNDGSIAVCETSTAAINLSSLITGEQPGGIWTRTTGTGGIFDALAGTYTPAVGATTSSFTYTVNGTPPCGPDSSVATVSISVAPNAGIDGSLTICQSTTPINLADIITGEQVGGSWIRTGGTGGTFNAAAGTFIPGFNATPSTFTYTVSGNAPCISDSSIATVNPITAPTANTPTAYEVCDDNNDGVACTFVLGTKTPEITTNPNVQVSYHLTPTDAQTGFNPIAPNQPFCNNDFDQQTIYIRVFDPLAPNCPTLTTLSLIVHPKP
ncbi:choice-of-anchor L domain-containing protein, partial [Flavobacterium sp.]